MLLRLIKFHQSEGVQSVVISLTMLDSVGKKLQASGVQVIYLGGRPGNLPSLKMIWRLIAVARSVKPDLIQGWMYHGNLAASWTALMWSRSVPVIWSVRQSLGTFSDERPLTRIIIRLGALLSSTTCGIIYNSRNSARQHENIGYSRKKTIFIPNGFAPSDQWSDRLTNAKTDSYCNGVSARFVLGHAARFHPKKGHDVLFEAVRQVLDRGWDIYLIAIGKNVNLNNEALNNLIPYELSKKRYSLLGEKENLTEFYAALDIFVSSSGWGEGFPNVVAEAMANKVTCVGTDVGETKELIGDTGVVVPPNDPTALAEGIISILTLPEGWRCENGILAAKKVDGEYGISKIGKRYLELYRNETASP